MDDNSWRYRAKCANDPVVQEELSRGFDRFHDTHGKSQEITKYCLDCPVIQECLKFALSIEKSDPTNRLCQSWGVWGGTSRNTRTRLLNNRKKEAQQKRILRLVEQMKALSQDQQLPSAS